MKNKEEYLKKDNKLEVFLNNELFSKYIENTDDFLETLVKKNY